MRADMRSALFLDRDGVINVDHGYVHRREDFEFIDGIFDLARCATERDHLIFVITNQAGIGRGMYTEREFMELTRWMCQVFSERGVPIANVYHCPFHPELGVGDFKRESIDRKPGPGMILRAALDFGIDLARSVLVGDRETDILAGIAAGIGCRLLFDPHGEPRTVSPDLSRTACVRALKDVESYLENRVMERCS